MDQVTLKFPLPERLVPVIKEYAGIIQLGIAETRKLYADDQRWTKRGGNIWLEDLQDALTDLDAYWTDFQASETVREMVVSLRHLAGGLPNQIFVKGMQNYNHEYRDEFNDQYVTTFTRLHDRLVEVDEKMVWELGRSHVHIRPWSRECNLY